MIRPGLLLLLAGSLLLTGTARAEDDADPWDGLRGEAAAPARPAVTRPAPAKPAAPKPAAPKPTTGTTTSGTATPGRPTPATANADKPAPPVAAPAQPKAATTQNPAAPSGTSPRSPAAEAMNDGAAAPKPVASPAPAVRPPGATSPASPAASGTSVPAAAPKPTAATQPAAPKPAAPSNPVAATKPATLPVTPPATPPQTAPGRTPDSAPGPAPAPAPRPAVAPSVPASAVSAYAPLGPSPMPLPPRRPLPPEPAVPMAPARAPAAAPVLAPTPIAAEAGGTPAGTPAPLLADTTAAGAPPASEPMAPIPEPVQTAAPAAHAGAEPSHEAHSAPAPAQDPPAEPSPAQADASAPHGAPAKAAPPAGRTDIYPVTLVRRLQRLQDLIAAGSTAGIAQQRAMITEMDAAFGDADPSVWQDPANARALVMYFLGGGNPAVLRAIINREPKPNIDEKLLTGSLLYLEGREEPALRQLGEIDARKLPNGIGGQIALAQAALTVRSDPAKASRLLEVARLLMPGTLVDEAALRRAVLVAAQAGDLDQFERLSGQYFSRFRHSAYAGNFRQRFAAALSRMNVLATPDGLSRLDALLAPLDEEARREVFLLVSRSAIVEGKTALATTAAERAMVLAPAASRDSERARVYLSAAQAATPDRYKTAEEALKAIDRARLDPSDQALLEAARRTAELIRRADEAPSQTTSPAPAAAPSAPAVVASAQPARTAGDEKPSAALTKAQAKLGEIDSLLKDAPR